MGPNKKSPMELQRLAGSLKQQASCAKEPHKRGKDPHTKKKSCDWRMPPFAREPVFCKEVASLEGCPFWQGIPSFAKDALCCKRGEGEGEGGRERERERRWLGLLFFLGHWGMPPTNGLVWVIRGHLVHLAKCTNSRASSEMCVCNTLHHTASHCKTLHNTAPHSNTQQHTATHCNAMDMTYLVDPRYASATPATYCNTVRHTAPLCIHPHPRCVSATHCNILQHTATLRIHCNTL